MTKATPDRRLTPRERRALAAKESRWKDLPTALRSGSRKAIFPAIVVLALTGIGAASYFNLTSSDDCPRHEHASFRVFVDDQQVSFRHRDFDMSAGMRMDAHMHQPEDHVLHLEGGCVLVDEAFGRIDVKMAQGKLVLDGTHKKLDQDATYRDDGNGTLKVFLYQDDTWGQWTVRDINKHQLRQGERLLITFGDEGPDEIALQQAAIPLPPGETEPMGADGNGTGLPPPG